MGIYRPKLSIFVSKLKDLEFHYRKKTLSSISQGASEVTIEKPLEDKLPFTQIYKILEGREKEIMEAAYNLRSKKEKCEFIDSISKLSKECYSYFFESVDFDNEADIGTLMLVFN